MTTTTDLQLDEKIARAEAARTSHEEAVADLAKIDRAIENGEPVSRAQRQDAQAEADHAALVLAGAERALDQALAEAPARAARVIHEPDAEAQRASLAVRLDEALQNLDADEKAVTKARTALEKSASKHAASLATVQKIKTAGGGDVELADAFAELAIRTKLFDGPVVTSHRKIEAPKVHEMPVAHVVQDEATRHGTLYFGVGQKSTTHDGTARGQLTATYWTRAGFHSPSAEDIIKAVTAAGWKASEHLVNIHTEDAADGRAQRHTFELTVDKGHVLAPKLDAAAQAETGRSYIGWGQAARLSEAIKSATDENGVTTTLTGYRIARIADAMPYGPRNVADRRDVDKAQVELPAAAARLVGTFEPGLGHVTDVRIVKAPAWASKSTAPKVTDDKAIAGELFIEVTAQHRKV